MTKEIIPHIELLKKVQYIISSCPECHDIHVDSIAIYPEQVNGANWDITNFRCSGADNDLESCRDSIKNKILELRSLYDSEPR